MVVGYGSLDFERFWRDVLEGGGGEVSWRDVRKRERGETRGEFLYVEKEKGNRRFDTFQAMIVWRPDNED